MTLIIIGAIIYVIIKLISSATRHAREAARQREIQRIKEEQLRQRQEQAWQRQEQARQREMWKRQLAEEKLKAQRMAQFEKKQAQMKKEQERHAAQLARHEEQIQKLNQRMAKAEAEIGFNREQRDRLFSLLDIAERERDNAIPESATWQKAQQKVISLENRIHTAQSKIDKALMDRQFCEAKLA